MGLIIFGGSFDPLHNGHLRIARAAKEELSSPVVFVPAKKPRWKETEETEGDRLAMLEAAIMEENDPAFSISRYELDKNDGEISYTIDTIRHFRSIYQYEELFFLMGGDEANRFGKWKDALELSRLCHIVYSPRPKVQIDFENIEKYNMHGLSYSESGEVSSNDVRSLRSADIPMSVLRYIEGHRLYYVRKIESYIGRKRTDHSLSVAHLCEEIIESNGLTSLKGKGYIAGAVHDIAKHLNEEEGRKAMLRSFPDIDSSKIPSFAVHQYAGVSLAKEIFGIYDADILDAISAHCLAKKEMRPLAKILYSADKIEPTRGYDSSKLIEGCLKDYIKGYEGVRLANEEFLKSKGGEK